MNNRVKVIDMPCGAGKTSFAIQYMNARPDESFVYCTPYLQEIGRIQESCGKSRFREPLPYAGRKIDDFVDLLVNGEDIAVTHITFLNSTTETIEAINNGEYTLIIDEAPDVVQGFNETQSVSDDSRQKVTKADVSFLIDKGIIEVNEDLSVKWCGGSTEFDFKFSEVQRFAELGRLYCVDRSFMITVFPKEIFSAFKNVYVLTYMFEGSTIKYYFDRYGIEYDMMGLREVNGKYELAEHDDSADIAFRQKCKELITVYDNKEANGYKKTQLSRSWFDKAGEEEFKMLKRHLGGFFNRFGKSPSEKMWTVYKDYAKSIKGKGYTVIRQLSKNDLVGKTESERKRLEQEVSCFVPCNARAVNCFRGRSALAYMMNLYPNICIRKFFTMAGVGFDANKYALCGLIQWMFRSQIRDGQPITIYIPSERMRSLFLDWLDRGGFQNALKKTFIYMLFLRPFLIREIE